jgi:uncharacterized protein YkwD
MRNRPSGFRLPAVLSAALLAGLLLSALAAPVSASTSATEAESMILGWMNRDRSAAGLVPLRKYHDLAVIAGRRATRMADHNTLSHSVGGNMPNQLDAFDVRWYAYGENIAYSTRTWTVEAAKHIYALWKSSAPHRKLMMSNDFNYVGIGLAYRSSNHKTFGSTVFTESPDHTGAHATMTSASRNGDDVRWSWTGSDIRLQTHTAGLRDYDVQYRVGSGSWVTLRNDTTSTSIILTDRTHGRTYWLRTRATDRRGNYGSWTAGLPIYVP